MYEEKPNDPLFVEAKPTPLTEEQAACALRQAFKNVSGHYPSNETLAILWAQSALEVGRWKFIYNHNFGNIKKLPDVQYTSYKCSEVLNGKNQWFYPYHPQTFFASWPSAEEGATAYLSFLTKKKRYATAWQEALSGNPVKFCAALKSGGYFTADLVQYTKGVVSLTEEFKKKFANYVWSEELDAEAIDVDISTLEEQQVQIIPPPLDEQILPPSETSNDKEQVDVFTGILEFLKNLFK